MTESKKQFATGDSLLNWPDHWPQPEEREEILRGWAKGQILGYGGNAFEYASLARAYLLAVSARSETRQLDEHTALQLAAISVATIQNTRDTAKQRIGKDSPYWTQTYEDVCTAVDREMRERERAEAAETIPSATRQNCPRCGYPEVE